MFLGICLGIVLIIHIQFIIDTVTRNPTDYRWYLMTGVIAIIFLILEGLTI